MSAIIGYVAQQSGTTNVTYTNGANEVLASHMSLHMNDRIETGDNGALVIVLDNGNTLRIGPNQVVLLDATVYENELAQDETAAEVAALQQALADTGDITDLEETAAGEEIPGGSGQLGSGTTEHIDNLGYAYAEGLGTANTIPNNTAPVFIQVADAQVTAATTTPVTPAVNTAPESGSPVLTTPEDTVLIITQDDLLAGSTDADNTISDLYVQNLAVSGGTLVDNGNGTWSFTPDENFNGNVTISYEISDGIDATPATATIDVTPVNDNPVAVGDSVSTTEDTAATYSVADLVDPNDTDLDGDTLTISAVSNAMNGSVVLNSDGTVTFTPDANFNGTATFDYTISDGNGGSATATVNVTVNAVDDVSVVQNDTATTNEDAAINIDVLANDSDIDSAKSPVDTVTQGANGSVSINADGTVRYTPNADFNGNDSFTYTNTDGETATVNVTVNAVDDTKPVGQNDSAEVAEGETVTINVAANDSDSESGLDLSSIVITGAPANGTVTVNADGTVDYAHDGSETTSDSFTYTIKDAAGNVSDPITVSVGVTAVDDVTVAQNDIAITNEDSAIDIDVLANDSDVDSAKAPVDIVTQGTNGSVSINADGTVRYTPDADFNGNDSFTYINTDGETAIVNVTVNPVNDAPTSASNTIVTDEDISVVIAASDFPYSDVDGDALASIRIDTLPDNGTLKLDGVALTSVTVISKTDLDANKLTFTPDANEFGNDYTSFTFSVNDGTVWSESASTITVNVNSVNDLPVAYDNNDSVLPDADTPDTASGNVIIDSYQDKVDVLGDGSTTVSAVEYDGTVYDLSSGAVTINAEYGDIEFNQDGSYTYTYTGPDAVTTGGSTLADWSGVTFYAYQGDGGLLSSDDNFEVDGKLDLASLSSHTTDVAENAHGIGVADTPSLLDWSNDSIDGNDALVMAFDQDITDIALQFNDTALLSVLPTVSWSTYDAAGNLVGDGSTSTFLSLFGSNDQSIQINSDEPFAYLVIETGGLLDNNYLYQASYTPAIDTSSIVTETFTYTIEDSDGDTSSADLTININGSEISVTSGSTDSAAFTEDQAPGILSVSGDLTNTLADGSTDGLFSTAVVASGDALGTLTIDENGTWNYEVNNDNLQSLAQDEVHIDSFIVTTADGTDSHVIRINITGTNDAPELTIVDNTVTAQEDILQEIDFATYGISYSDIDGDDLTLTATVDNGTVYVDQENGKLYYLSPADYSGSATIELSVTDGMETVTEPIYVTVDAVADAHVNDFAIDVGTSTTVELNFTTDTNLDGVSSYTFDNGTYVTIAASGGDDVFSWSNGALLGIGAPQTDGGSGIAGTESIDFSFPLGMQYVQMTLKNASNDTVKFESTLDINDLPADQLITVGLTSSYATANSIAIDSSNSKVTLLINGVEYTDATISNTNDSWTIDYSSYTGTITSMEVVTLIDGNLFNNGGQDYVAISTNVDMQALSVGQDLSREVITYKNNGDISSIDYYGLFSDDNGSDDGFQIEAVEMSTDADGSVIYSTPIDIYAAVQDHVGAVETFGSLTLKDLPADAVISIVYTDGSYKEIHADANGEYQFTADDLAILDTNTSTTDFVDNVYLVTSQPYTDTPTAIIEVHDGSSTAEAIFGGTVTTTDANGISVTEGVDLQGGDTDDYIAGSAYADTIDGGAGNDEIVFDLLDSSIDGGTGNDTLLVTESGALDFSNVSNIETIDLTDGSAENITNISVQDVFDMTDDNNTLVINGDGGSDEVHLFNDGTKEWTAGTAEDIGGVTYDVYSYTDGIDTAVVKIQQDLTHDVQS